MKCSSNPAKKNIPGHGYFSENQLFIGKHCDIGEFFMEYKKGECFSRDGIYCFFCTTHRKQISLDVLPIPRPFPDYSCLPEFPYCSLMLTLRMTEGKLRPMDDYAPRVQLKKLFYDGKITSTNCDKVTAFSNKYILDEKLTRKYLEHSEMLETEKLKRPEAKANRKETIENSSVNDYDWMNLYEKTFCQNYLTVYLISMSELISLVGLKTNKIKWKVSKPILLVRKEIVTLNIIRT